MVDAAPSGERTARRSPRRFAACCRPATSATASTPAPTGILRACRAVAPHHPVRKKIPPAERHHDRSSTALSPSAETVELAFLGYALECLARALDTVLVIVAVGRKQLDDPIGAVRGHVTDRP